MRAREVYEAVCGRDFYGENRALVKLETGFINKNTLEETMDSHIDMNNPEVEIHQNARLTLVNLIFEDGKDPDFAFISDMINRFQTMEHSMDDEKIPSISLTVMPKEMEGVFIHGVSGIVTMQASDQIEAPNMVSVVFTNDCIHAYMLDMEQMEECLF